MKLDDYLKREFSGSRAKGMVGVESDWLDFCSLEFPLGEVHVVDTGYVTDKIEGCIVSLRPGRYEIKVKAIAYGKEVRIARLRVVAETVHPTLGQKMDETGTDSGTIGVCELQTFSQLFKKDPAATKEAFKSMDPTEPHSIVTSHSIVTLSDAPGGRMAAINSGFGDGGYPVYELLDRSERVGFEVVFIKTDQPYPWEVEETPKPYEDDKLHCKLLENLWNDAYAALNQGEKQAREFFGKLSPSRRALFFLRIFVNYTELMSGGLLSLMMHKAQPFLAEEILAGFHLVGASMHEERFRQLCLVGKELWEPAELRERIKIQLKLTRVGNPSREEIEGLKEWFEDAGKDPNRKIERFIGVYVRSHPAEFPDAAL